MSVKEKIMEIEGFKKLTPIQEAVVSRKDPTRDLIGISSTGSGKSHAFFMPVLEAVDPDLDQVQAVISTPTRELAYQLYERLKKLAASFDVRVRLVTGGMERKEGGLTPQVVIGTPGRMKDDFLEAHTLRLDTAKLFIIDEADMTMEFGFLEDVDQILSHMSEKTTVMVFSATIPENLQPFLKKYLHNPEMITISSDEEFQANVKKYLVPAKHKSYEEKLLDVLPAIQPYVCLIFANTTEEAAKTAKLMREHGYDLVELHSGLESRARNQAIRAIQTQKHPYIVASDIASRGIDLDGITHVISLGFPKDLKFFTHRIGRTGRAGRDGMAIAIYKPEDETRVHILQKKGMEFEHADVKKGEFVILKPFEQKQKKKADPLEKEIRAVVQKKKSKVKPNYKKRQREEIDRLRRKHKREIIRKDIQRQKKERAKEKQRQKSREN